MVNGHSIAPKVLRIAAVAMLAPLAAVAQTPPVLLDGARLERFRTEAEAFNRSDPMANAYRAGHYNGYLAGVLDTLQGRSVCFRECVCELDKLVGAHLAANPQAHERPVVEWLVPLLEARYPCR